MARDFSSWKILSNLSYFFLVAGRYDVSRAQSAMEDVETYLNSLWNDVDKDDEEKFTRYVKSNADCY